VKKVAEIDGKSPFKGVQNFRFFLKREADCVKNLVRKETI